jgi:hypothetical protein
MAIDCSTRSEEFTEFTRRECADEEEVTVSEPALNWKFIAIFLLGLFLVINAMELSNEIGVYYGVMVTLFFFARCSAFDRDLHSRMWRHHMCVTLYHSTMTEFMDDAARAEAKKMCDPTL